VTANDLQKDSIKPEYAKCVISHVVRESMPATTLRSLSRRHPTHGGVSLKEAGGGPGRLRVPSPQTTSSEDGS
jgi:hypothetical protein